jgi:predicted RNA binding protein YcfA (HicA-like mRNA interferase family)
LKAGWYEDRQRGGHVILKNPAKPGRRVTLAMHRNKTMKPRTLQSVLVQADLTIEQFIELL